LKEVLVWKGNAYLKRTTTFTIAVYSGKKSSF